MPSTPEEWIALYLAEDLGDAGDVTSDSVFPDDQQGAGRVVAREPCFLAGVAHARTCFSLCSAATTTHMNDGSWVDSGDVIISIEGPTRHILAAERLALNLLGRMSGIATMTHQAMERIRAVGGTAQVAATRKTTPGFRWFEKEAVRIAGGDPHRAGLHDAAMIKDNHREAAGDIGAAVEAIRARHETLEITAEVESLDDGLQAAAAGADRLLIDNQTGPTGAAWAKALRAAYPDVLLEASGGITIDTVADFAWADRISLGQLTQGYRAMDFSLEWGA